MPINYAVGQRLTATMLQTLADYTVNRPIVRLVVPNAATQSLTDSVATAMTFGTGSTVIDTHTYHSETTNNTRITPLIAGYYLFRVGLVMGSRSDYRQITANVRLNGSTNLAMATRFTPAAPAASQAQSVFSEVETSMNGTTDYAEFIATQANNAAVAQATNASTQFSSYFEMEYLRPT